MKLALETDQALMKQKADQKRLTVEVNESAELVLARELENKKMLQEHSNSITMAQQVLEKSNMGDENMLRHKAIELAKQSYAGKYIEKTSITNLGKDDPSTAVLAGMLAKFEICKSAAGVVTQ